MLTLIPAMRPTVQARWLTQLEPSSLKEWEGFVMAEGRNPRAIVGASLTRPASHVRLLLDWAVRLLNVPRVSGQTGNIASSVAVDVVARRLGPSFGSARLGLVRCARFSWLKSSA